LPMEKQHYSLRSIVGFFFNKPIGFSRDFHAEFPEIFLEPDLNVLNMKAAYRFSRTREGLLLQTELSGEIEAQCVRCLAESIVPVFTKFEELFYFPERTQEETDQLVPADGYLDLADIFRDYLLLEIPINHLCKPDCKGVCVECGQNLNLADCGHTHSRIILPEE